MSSGSIFLFLENGVAPDLGALERMLQPIGVSLENPTTHQVSMLSPIGEQMFTTRETVSSLLAAHREVSLQWWHTDSEDVYCRFNPHAAAGQWSIEFALDGVEEHDAEDLIAVIRSFFAERCARGEIVAVVVDRTGRLEEIAWNTVIGG